MLRLDADEGFDETWVDDHPCYGHNPEDVQPFHSLFLGDDTTEGLGEDAFDQVCLHVPGIGHE